MLLPDNIQPELSIYYNGSLVLNELKKKNDQTLNWFKSQGQISDSSC